MKFHSKKILILIIVCNAVALAAYYFLFQHIKSQSEVSSSLISIINLSQQKDSRYNLLKNTVSETETKRQQFSTFLLSKDKEVDFIGQIEALAKNSKLSEKTNNVSSSANTARTLGTFQMQAGTTGTWNDSLYFLSQVENLPYEIHLQNVYLQKQSADGKGIPAWSGVFDLSVSEST